MEALISRIRDDQTAVEAAAHSLAVRCHQHDFADSRLLRTQATKRTKKTARGTARGRAHDRENTAPGYRAANDGGEGYLADPADAAAYGTDTFNGGTGNSCSSAPPDASPAHAHTIGPGTYNPRPSEFERGTSLARRPSPWSLSTHASGRAGKAGKAARGGALLSGDGGDELALGALGSLGSLGGGGVCNNGRDIPAEQLERARNAVRKRTDIGVLAFAPPPPVGGSRGRGSYGRDDGGGDDDGGGSGIGGSGGVGGAGAGKGKMAASLLLDPRRGGPEAGDYNPAQVRRRRRRHCLCVCVCVCWCVFVCGMVWYGGVCVSLCGSVSAYI